MSQQGKFTNLISQISDISHLQLLIDEGRSVDGVYLLDSGQLISVKANKIVGYNAVNFPSLADIPANFDGVARVGAMVISGDGVGAKNQRVMLQTGARTGVIGHSIAARVGFANGKPWLLTGVAENSTEAIAGVLPMLNLTCGHPFNIVANHGVAGEKSGEIAARFDDFLSHGPYDVIYIDALTNDIGAGGYTALVSLANIQEMARKAIAHGAFVIVMAAYPKTSMSAAGATQKALANLLISNWCQQTENVLYIQTDAGTTDNTTNLLSDWATDANGVKYASTDGVHPDSYEGIYRAIELAIEPIKRLFRPYPLISNASDTWDGYGSPAAPMFEGANLINANMSLMRAQGGTLTVGSADGIGTPPVGYTLTLSGAGLLAFTTIVPRVDGVGNDLVIALEVASGNGQTLELSYQNSVKFTQGKFYEASCEVEIVADSPVPLHGSAAAVTATIAKGDTAVTLSSAPQLFGANTSLVGCVLFTNTGLEIGTVSAHTSGTTSVTISAAQRANTDVLWAYRPADYVSDGGKLLNYVYNTIRTATGNSVYTICGDFSNMVTSTPRTRSQKMTLVTPRYPHTQAGVDVRDAVLAKVNTNPGVGIAIIRIGRKSLRQYDAQV